MLLECQNEAGKEKSFLARSSFKKESRAAKDESETAASQKLGPRRAREQTGRQGLAEET